MPQSVFTGAQKFQYDTAGNNYAAATDLYPCKADSSSTINQPNNEKTTEGDILFAGETREEKINVYDLSAYDALRAKMLADERIDLRYVDIEGNTNDVALSFIPLVQKPNMYDPGKRRFFTLIVTKFLVS